MRKINFNKHDDLPIVDAVISGPISHERVRLVFDSGCSLTQIDTGFIESIGYSVTNAKQRISVRGPVGDTAEGYIVEVASLNLFGFSLANLDIGVYDFDNCSHFGIDGLIGFDLIKKMHFELNGSQGVLRLFDIAC